MNVLVTGGTGFIGKQVIQLLLEEGHDVTNLTTQKNQERRVSENFRHVFWNPHAKELHAELIPEIHAVIHLAGFSVANKWTQANKELMISSRIESTHFLCDFLNSLQKKPKIFVGASASGFYKNSYDWQDETSEKGSGFLSDLTNQWEKASDALHESIRKIHLRIGVVLSARDGALKKLTPIFKAGLGSAVGNGNQFMSWIHEDDLVRLFTHCISNDLKPGAYNATAPNPVTNKKFSKTLAQALHRPFFLPNTPEFILRILFGEMSQLVLVSQRLSSVKTESTGFNFHHKTIEDALNTIYGKAKN